jgi:hypothetical protein
MKKLFIRAIAILVIGTGLLFAIPTPAPAAGVPHYINLTYLDGTAAQPINVSNVAPGDSGVSTIVVQNTSSYNANIYIWLSNITGTENTPASLGTTPATYGNLKDDLQFTLNGSALTSNISSWTALANFPQSETDTSRQLIIANMAPAGTATLNWGWRLPYSAGNQDQGDSISFDINYGLEQITSGGGGGGIIAPPTTTPPTTSPIITSTAPATTTAPVITSTAPATTTSAVITSKPPDTTTSAPIITPTRTPNPGGAVAERTIQLEAPKAQDTTGVTDQGVVIGGLQVITPKKDFSLFIPEGTTVQASNENRQNQVDLAALGDFIPAKIEVTIPEINTLPPFPDPWFPVSPAYDINGITAGVSTGVKMDQPAVMVIAYDIEDLPEIVEGLALFYYNYLVGWVQLDPPTGWIAEGAEMAAQVEHFSLFVVLARGEAGTQKKPANFVVDKLTVNPPRIQVGQSSEVRVRISNTGGLTGEYVAVVKMDGKVQKTQTVRLGPGQSAEVNFILTPLTAGVYTVTTAKLKDGLTVNPLLVPDISETNYWWLLFMSMGVATLVFSFSRRKKKVQTVPAAGDNTAPPADSPANKIDYIDTISKDNDKQD